MPGARQVLIITNEQDLAADLVVLALERRSVDVLRCNTERLTGWRMTVRPGLAWRLEDRFGRTASSETTSSVWWRRPQAPTPSVALASASQQAAFDAQWQSTVEALASVPGPRWVSRPAAIRAAENKAAQLSVAARLGFRVPPTAWTNDRSAIATVAADGTVVAKPVTTAAWDDDDGPAFVFAQLLDAHEFPREEDLALLPAAFQRPVWPKLDVRVTVVGTQVFAAVVEPDSELDWRLKPDRAWTPHTLPAPEAERCARLVADLGLRFGGIDLAVDATGDAWFIEVNPNGEWGWLAQGHAQLPIVETLADDLTLRGA